MPRGSPSFIIEAVPLRMDLTAHVGVTLVTETMRALGVDAVVEEVLRLGVRPDL